MSHPNFFCESLKSWLGKIQIVPRWRKFLWVENYRNYVLQCMVGMKSAELTEMLVRQLKGHFVSLSRNKYGSNVVEKCLTEVGPVIREKIILEMIKSPNSSALFLEPYGNFVIRSALNATKVS